MEPEKNTSKTNRDKNIHPWAMHGDNGAEHPLGIIRLPDALSFQPKEPEIEASLPPTSATSMRNPFEKTIQDASSVALMIEQTPPASEQDRPEITKSAQEATLIEECSVISSIIEQRNPIDFQPKAIPHASPAPDQDLLESLATCPTIFPSSQLDKKEVKKEVPASNEPDMEKRQKPSEETPRQETSSPPAGFTQIHTEEKELTKDFSESEMKKSNFLQWLQSQKSKEENESRSAENSEKISQTEKNRLEEEKKQAKKAKKAKKKARKKAKKKKKKAKKKAKEKKLEELLRSSNEIGDEILSETLAKLLAHQGHTDRAIDMYKKLSLLNPKKSSYFADIIEKLEEK